MAQCTSAIYDKIWILYGIACQQLATGLCFSTNSIVCSIKTDSHWNTKSCIVYVETECGIKHPQH